MTENKSCNIIQNRLDIKEISVMSCMYIYKCMSRNNLILIFKPNILKEKRFCYQNSHARNIIWLLSMWTLELIESASTLVSEKPRVFALSHCFSVLRSLNKNLGLCCCCRLFFTMFLLILFLVSLSGPNFVIDFKLTFRWARDLKFGL